MTDRVSSHYDGGGGLAGKIAQGLRRNGLEPHELRPSDLESVDEFHFRGRAATLELIDRMTLTEESKVLDIGSGLGGVSRTIAEVVGCPVIGIDLTPEFCEAATELSRWVGLSGNTTFQQGDALNLAFDDHAFDAVVTVHVAMNIENKMRMYKEAHRVLSAGGTFAVYDILQGDGGDMLYPAPWARDPSISHLATPDEMEALLAGAGFEIVQAIDSTKESLEWLEARTAQSDMAKPLPVTTELLFGAEFRDMTRNQLRGLKERRMLTVSYICKA